MGKFPFHSKERSPLLSYEAGTIQVRFGEIFVLKVPGITYAISLVAHQFTAIPPKQGYTLESHSLRLRKGMNRKNIKSTN